MFYAWEGFLPVFLLLRAGPTAAAPDICNVPGQCSDELIGVRFAESLESCIIQGTQIEAANFVSWQPTPPGPCSVFAECEIDDSINAVTSSLDCKVCGAAGHCSGHIEAQAIVQGDDECEQLCLETPNCAWFSYLEEQQYCLILADCSSLITDCTNCYTSMRSCLEETSTTPPTTSTTTSGPPAMNKIFHIYRGETTLVSLDGTTANCALEDYPGYEPTAATYKDGEILACGGNEVEDTARCWSFNGSVWSSLPNTNQNHCGHSTLSVLVNDGWWISGYPGVGSVCYDDYVTTEIYSTNWNAGPGLPGSEFYEHACLVNLNTTLTFLVSGGYLDPDAISGKPTTDVWFYNWNSKAWTKTGSLIQGRWWPGCVSLGGEGILVVGGVAAGGNSLNTVELYDPAKGTWSTQPDLPTYGQAVLLNWGDEVLGLFSNEKIIYKRSRENGEWSVLDGVQLSNAFMGNVYDKALLVPDNWSCNPNK